MRSALLSETVLDRQSYSLYPFTKKHHQSRCNLQCSYHLQFLFKFLELICVLQQLGDLLLDFEEWNILLL